MHHSDRGSQYLSIRYTDRLAEAEIEPSVGSRGDSYYNALIESLIGLYKTEVIRRKGPWRGFDDVEYATLEWVDWYNTQRPFGPIRLIPSAEHKANYHREDEPPAASGWTQLIESPENPARFSKIIGYYRDTFYEIRRIGRWSTSASASRAAPRGPHHLVRAP